MTDNTQELDEILSKSKQIVTTNYAEISKWSAIAHLELTEEAKQQIIDWHNKQIEEVLDRLEKDFTRGIEKGRTVSFLATLRAERAKLKEVK